MRTSCGRPSAWRRRSARARLRSWSSDAEDYGWLVEDVPQVERFRVIDGASDISFDALRSDLYSLPITLLESPPFRVLLVHHDAGDVVMLAIHHAASDGMGTLRLLQSIMRAYAGLADDVMAPDRGRREPRKHGADPGTGGGDLRKVVQSSATPTKLAATGATTQPGYGVRTAALPLAPILASPLRRRLGATVNDVILAAALRSIDDWQGANDEPADRVSIAMPMNQRPDAWRHDVLGNYLTREIVATADAQRLSPEACLAAAGPPTSVK